MRGVALLLAAAGAAAVLSGCEYADDVSTAAPAVSSRPAPPPLPPVDPGLAEAEARNLDELTAVLGARPDALVLGGAGGIGGSGFGHSVAAVPEGTYTLTGACIGAPHAYLTLSQDGLRGGGSAEMSLTCGAPAATQVDLSAGPVQVHGFRYSTDPAAGEVAGFWLVPAAGP
jgi:hypothetical protein